MIYKTIFSKIYLAQCGSKIKFNDFKKINIDFGQIYCAIIFSIYTIIKYLTFQIQLFLQNYNFWMDFFHLILFTEMSSQKKTHNKIVS